MFHGDPRIVFFEVILSVNKWVDVFVCPIVFFLFFKRISGQDLFVVMIGFAIGEFTRFLLLNSHKIGDAPKLMGFLILTVIPTLVFEVIWIVMTKSMFELSLMIVYVIFDVLEFVFGIVGFARISRHQHSFYQFFVPRDMQ